MGMRPSRLGAKAHPKCPLLCVLCWLAGWLCAQAKVCDVNTELKLHQFHPSNSQCVLVCVQGMGYATEVGEGPGRGFNVNVGWAEKGVGDADYMAGAVGGGGGGVETGSIEGYRCQRSRSDFAAVVFGVHAAW